MFPFLQASLPDFDPSIAEEFGEGAPSTLDFLGVPLFQADSLIHLLLRFGFNLLVGWLIIHFLYYRKNGRRDYYLTFMIFSSTMFMLIFLMENVKLQLGFTLGLFAIFGMIRYRTETVPVREMTYLFVIIGLSVINGLALNITYAELLAANGLLIGLIYLLESQKLVKHRSTKLILYDRIDLIVPERRTELIEDLHKRTGIEIEKVEIGHVDFLKDAAFIKISYSTSKNDVSTIEGVTKIRPEM